MDITNINKLRIFYIILIIIISQSVPYNSCLAVTKAERTVSFGLMKYFFTDVNVNDAKVAMNGWVNELGKEYKNKTGVSIHPVIFYIDDVKEMMEMVKNKKLDVLILSTYDYIFHDFNKVVVPYMMDKPDERMVKVLLVNKNMSIKNLFDLKSKKLSVEPGIEGIFSDYWLNMLFKQNGVNDYKTFFSGIETLKKSNMVIMQLFFGKTDAVVTSLFNFKTNCEVNPQIKERIRPFISSEYLPYSVVGIRNDCNSIDGIILTEIAVNVLGNSSMKSIMEMFKKGAVSPYSDDKMIPVRNLIKFNQNKTDKDILKNKRKNP